MLSSLQRMKLDATSVAISEYKAGKPVTAICPICHMKLYVWLKPEVGDSRVWCDIGCTNSHTKFRPQPPILKDGW